MTIFLVFTISVHSYSQNIIEVDGIRYNDVEFTNTIIQERNEAIELLHLSRNTHVETIKVVEQVIYEDHIVTEYIKKERKVFNWRSVVTSFIVGFAIGMGTMATVTSL